MRSLRIGFQRDASQEPHEHSCVLKAPVRNHVPGEWKLAPLDIRVRVIQLSPSCSSLAGLQRTWLLPPPAFLTCCCPVALSGSGKSGSFEVFAPQLRPTLLAIHQACTTAHREGL